MKRTASLLIALSLVVLAAPAAMAEDCFICRFSFATCRPATATSTNAWTQCTDGEGICTLDGSPCTGAVAASAAVNAPLASDFVVASVERLDEAQQPAQTLVASAAPAPAVR